MFENIMLDIELWLKSKRSLRRARRALEAAFKTGTVHRAVCTFEGVTGTGQLHVEFELYDKTGKLLSCAELFPNIHETTLRVAMDQLGLKKGFSHDTFLGPTMRKHSVSTGVLTYNG